MRIVLHIGLHKTGTTSLQHILKTRFSTLTPNGIWYPPTEPGGPGHAVIVHEFFGFSGAPANPSALRTHVETAHRERVDTLVLSAEDFFYARPEQIPLLADVLKGHDVDLFLTMSPLLRRAVSLWQESVKHGDPTALPDALPQLMDQARYALTVFEAFIERLQPKNAHVVIVDTKASPFKLIRDFWRAADLGSIVFKEEDNIGVQLNRSFNMVETELLRCINDFQRRGIDEQNPNYLLHGAPAAGTYLINAAFLTPSWGELCPKKTIEAPESWRFVFHELAQENITKLEALKDNYGLHITGDMETLAFGTEPKKSLQEDKADDYVGHGLQSAPDIPSVVDIPVISLEQEEWGASMSSFEANRNLSDPLPEKGSLVLHAGAIDLPAKPISLRTLFVQPAYPEHSPWLEYVPFAFWLMDAHRPRLFAQIGVGRGTSYFAFCQSVQRLGLNTRCYGIDTWTAAEDADTAQKDAYRKVKAYNGSEYAHFSTILQGNAEKALDYFQDGSIGLLNIDIQGDSLLALGNIENWITKLSEKAIILIHNISNHSSDTESSNLIKKLKKTYKHFEFSYGDGLIAFAIGDGYAEHVNFIFQSEGYDSSISEVFYRIGKACYDSARVGALTEELSALELERSQQRALIETMSSEQSKHQGILEDRLRELGWFKHALEKSTLDADQHQAELEKAQARIAELEAERGRSSADAEQAASALEERIAQADAEAKAEQAHLKAEIERLAGELAERDRTVAALAEKAEEERKTQAAALDAAEVRLTALTSNLRDAQIRTEGTKVERERLADQLAERDRTVAALAEKAEKERKAHATALGAAETRLEALVAELRDAQARAESAEVKHERLAGELAERDRTVAALAEKAEEERKTQAAALDGAEARLEALAAELRDVQARAESAETERSRTQAEAAHMAAILQVRYREITDLVQALESERNHHGTEQAELKAQTSRLETSLQTTQQALADAQEQNIASATERAELRAELDRRTCLLEDGDRRSAVLVQQMAEERAQSQAIRDTLRQAEASAAAAKAEERALREEIGRITGKFQSQQSDLAALTQEIEGTRARHAAELAVMTELLEQSSESTSCSRSTLLAMTLGFIKSMCAHATSIPNNSEAIQRISDALAVSGAFDPEWYRSTYEDVAASNMDPLLHFIIYGYSEGRLPSQSFA